MLHVICGGGNGCFPVAHCRLSRDSKNNYILDSKREEDKWWVVGAKQTVVRVDGRVPRGWGRSGMVDIAKKGSSLMGIDHVP